LDCFSCFVGLLWSSSFFIRLFSCFHPFSSSIWYLLSFAIALVVYANHLAFDGCYIAAFPELIDIVSAGVGVCPPADRSHILNIPSELWVIFPIFHFILRTPASSITGWQGNITDRIISQSLLPPFCLPGIYTHSGCQGGNILSF
jgi:hypothetical protein